MSPLALVVALLVSQANAADAPPVRLALIEDSPTRTTLTLAQPLERVLREAGKDAALVDVENVPVYFGGSDYRFRLPPGPGAPSADTSSASALESDSEVVFVFPDAPDLTEALQAAAADSKTFRVPDSVRLTAVEADFAATTGPDGETLLALTARLRRPAAGRVRAGLAAYYRLRWKGRDVAVAVVGRTFGGLGRLGSAAESENARRPFTGLARGLSFGSPWSDAPAAEVLAALERAGLKYSAVNEYELAHWKELTASMASRPGGVRWLSANLVYSTAPAVTVLPPYTVFEASGTKVAVVAVTPQWAESAFKSAGLKGFKILDPVAALEPLIPKLRAEADIVIALAGSADSARLSTSARGLDLVLGDNTPYLTLTSMPATIYEQDDRPVFANAFPPVRAYTPALNIVDVARTPDGDRVDWRVVQSAVLLDDSINPAEGYPEPSYSAFEVLSSTVPPLMPDARAVFAAEERARGFQTYEPRDFWTLAAGVLSERAKAEAGVLVSPALGVQSVGEIRESYVRDWMAPPSPAVLVAIKGDRLRSLIDESAEQVRREAAGLTLSRARFVVGGVDSKKRVRGAPLDSAGTYRIATSRSSAEELGLPEPYEPLPGGPTVDQTVIEELRARAGRTSPADYHSWMAGAPLSEPGLWRLNFRDVGLNLRQTKVVRNDEFDPVPNSRVQGFNELLVGGVFKADAEYLKSEFKWTNTVEAEYAKSRIEPRHSPATVNLASNRIMLLTLATRRAGGIRAEWFARSYGPSVGFQYDGEFESAPGLRRKQTYSLFPGVEFFDGTFIRSMELAGIVKRDLGREPPNTQTGVRLRSVYSKEVGPSKAVVHGELWNNYFFLTKQDTAGDLRMEGDFNIKLRVPIRRYLSVAPYFDFYWFQLKTRPTWGYTTTLGVSIGFTRLWKPQYEPF